MTKAELQKELKKRDIAFESDANKARLESLLAEANEQDKLKNDDAPADPVDPAATDEGPTELGDPDHNTDPIPDVGDAAPLPEGFDEAKKGDLVVLDPVSHNGRVYPVGSKFPEDEASDEQIARLKRLGNLAKN